MSSWTLALFAFLLSFSAQGKSPNSTCSPSDLERKNCLLEAGPYRVHLTKTNMILNDSLWRWVDSLPLSGEGTSWHKAHVEKKLERYFLHFLVWDAPQGETHHQRLKWYVVELSPKQSKVALEKVVRRRQAHQSREKGYLSDPETPFGLKEKNKNLMWTLGHHSGEL